MPWVVLLYVALLPPSLVLAQPQHALEDITVTARKQEQRAFDVPLSLSVLQGEGLDRLRASGMDVRFLTNRVPSLQVMSGFGRIYPYFFIRGLGNTDFDMNASQPVSVMHDGIVLENPWLKGHPIFDVERVEVLRGPQGTLFGRNTPAGIVKVESARPDLGRSKATVGYPTDASTASISRSAVRSADSVRPWRRALLCWYSAGATG